MQEQPLPLILSGPSGIGKTTLCDELSKALDMPVIKTPTISSESSIKVSSQAGLLTMPIEEQVEFQVDLLNRRFDMMKRNCGVDYVSDRSTFDSLVYFALHQSPLVSDKVTNSYIRKVADSTKYAPLTVLLTVGHTKVPVEDDGRRSANSLYRTTQNIMFSYLSDIIYPLWVDDEGSMSEILSSVIGDIEGDKLSVNLSTTIRGDAVLVQICENDYVSTRDRVRYISELYDMMKYSDMLNDVCEYIIDHHKVNSTTISKFLN